ncbi:phosphatidylinositol alpha-mannosyltransferase [Tessaracoccus bendigoensis DSM 12906]|uniref:Phosphatidylinositol alpha-mannosyltransferase n=1 Tax=Tessaracoccus bendigoensis DSM 12906 TaxID=1123357 RepID=A0A1M6KJB5_9ACTN|nr:phosphatidylinositol alpha-mannosyltransferase [Tessaracoccus bendigoensis DSM 12906]
MVPYSLDVPGGVATHVLGLARWLQGRGHEPWVFAPGVGRVDAAVPVTLLGAAVALPFNGSVARLALRPSQSRALLAGLTGFDVAHVHEPLTPGVGFAAASRCPVPLVVTHHAAFTPRTPVTQLLRRRALRLPNRVSLAVSPSAAALVNTIGAGEPRIVPNAIELPTPPEARTGRPRVVFVGRLTERRKGYEAFVEAAGLVPEADFIAVGPGGSGAPKVTELGRLTDEALGEVLAGAAVLVAPNLFGESFGMVLVEALARGVAVVASDLPAFRAVASDADVVGFFPVGDVSAAVARIRERLAQPCDPFAAWRLARRFSWDVVGPHIEDAYQRATLPVPDGGPADTKPR